MRVTPQELQAVLQLDGASRYRYFVKRVVDREAAFGLWRDGWALAEAPNSDEALALWPALEFAASCANGDWTGREVRAVSLGEMLAELLPSLLANGVGVAVFPTPDDKGVIVGVERLRADLERESELY